jgi:hypothetical protein
MKAWVLIALLGFNLSGFWWWTNPTQDDPGGVQTDSLAGGGDGSGT